MSLELRSESATMLPECFPPGEGIMVREECWKEVHRLFREERVAIAEIARRLDLDRKTMRDVSAGAHGSHTAARRAHTRCWPSMRRFFGIEPRGSTTRLGSCSKNSARAGTGAATRP